VVNGRVLGSRYFVVSFLCILMLSNVCLSIMLYIFTSYDAIATFEVNKHMYIFKRYCQAVE